MSGVSDRDLVDRVRRRLAAMPTVPTAPAPLEAVVRASSGIADDEALADVQQHVAAELTGAGPLESLLAQPGVTDVLVNGADEVWVDCGGLQLTPVRFADDRAVRLLAQRLAAATGRRLDDARPFVDAALPDGTRVHAILPPLVARPTLSLRVLARRRFGLLDLIAAGAMPAAVAQLLTAIVAARLSFVISGGTGTGKTTLLGALLSCCPATERVLLIEDTAEVVLGPGHFVRLVGRGANVEGAGAIGAADLVRQALRMRPDRLVVGEFRGAEFIELVIALNTGHDGGAATLHANSAADVPARFAALGAQAGVPSAAVHVQVASAFQLVIALRREHGGARRVDEIALLERCGDELRLAPVWTPHGIAPGAVRLARLIAQREVPVPELLR